MSVELPKNSVDTCITTQEMLLEMQEGNPFDFEIMDVQCPRVLFTLPFGTTTLEEIENLLCPGVWASKTESTYFYVLLAPNRWEKIKTMDCHEELEEEIEREPGHMPDWLIYIGL